MNRQEFLDKISSFQNIELEYAHEFESKEKKDFLTRMRRFGRIDFVKNYDKIFDFSKEFTIINFLRTELGSCDKLYIQIELHTICRKKEKNEAIIIIGYICNTCGQIECLCMTEYGKFGIRDNNNCYHWISYNVDDFLNYLLTKEYDYHIPISQNTINRLKKSGWYEGRKVDISHIIEVCENNNVKLTKPQKDFLSEFAGIYNSDNDKNEGLLVVDNDSFGEGSEKYFLEKYKNLEGYQTIEMSIGYIQGQIDDLYLTPDGRLACSLGAQGRTAMESWELLLN